MQPEISGPNFDDLSEENQLIVISSSEKDEEVRDTVDDINLITSSSTSATEKRDLTDFITATIHSLQSSKELQNFRKSFENLIENCHSNSQEFIQSSQISLKRKTEKQKSFCTTRKARVNSVQGIVRRSHGSNITLSHLVTTQIEKIN